MSFRRASLKRLQLNAFGYATWKSYEGLRKKAVEQEFTWGGFMISLSIAFLFVVTCSSGLNSLYENVLTRNADQENRVIILERLPDRAIAQLSIC